MSYSDEHLRARVEKLEREACISPRLHRARVLVCILIGYGFPLFLLTIATGMVAVMFALLPYVLHSAQDTHDMLLAWGVGAVIVASLAFWVIRSFIVELPEADGELLRPEGEPLAQLVEEVRRATGAPRVHEIRLGMSFNAGILQVSRLGPFGPAQSALTIGIPMLAALKPDELRLVLAHEMGHLVGNHGRFAAWTYRVSSRWETLSDLPRSRGRASRLVLDWFLGWYPRWLAATTLPLRRRHEYAADRTGADIGGEQAMAAVLRRIDWVGWRIDHELWPGLLRSAVDNEVPPPDMCDRLVSFVGTPGTSDSFERWLRRQRRTRSQIYDEHPSLAERMEALGQRELLDSCLSPEELEVSPSTMRALELLGESRKQTLAVMNAMWKAVAIARWRASHAAAREAVKKAGSPVPEGVLLSVEEKWNRLSVLARYREPEQAMEMLLEFVESHPGHAEANFLLGETLLDVDDERGIASIEAAMDNDSNNIAPGLSLLLDYHRSLGNDREADAIKDRLERLEKNAVRARRERDRVTARDQFLPHELDPDALEKVRRVLFYYPRVKVAWLVRKRVTHFADKLAYVLVIDVTRNNTDGDRILKYGIAARLSIPCTVVVLSGFRSGGLRKCVARVPDSLIFEA